MKKLIFMFSLSLTLFSLTAFAAGPEQYKYDSGDKTVIDTATGKVYRFAEYNGQVRQVEIDYIQGTVTALKTVDSASKELLQLKDTL